MKNQLQTEVMASQLVMQKKRNFRILLLNAKRSKKAKVAMTLAWKMPKRNKLKPKKFAVNSKYIKNLHRVGAIPYQNRIPKFWRE